MIWESHTGKVTRVAHHDLKSNKGECVNSVIYKGRRRPTGAIEGYSKGGAALTVPVAFN